MESTHYEMADNEFTVATLAASGYRLGLVIPASVCAHDAYIILELWLMTLNSHYARLIGAPLAAASRYDHNTNL